MMANDDRICPHQTYGQHIALYCVDHPDKRWSTKNIGHIGARSIFYFDPTDGHIFDVQGPECPCSLSKLRVLCPECQSASKE